MFFLVPAPPRSVRGGERGVNGGTPVRASGRSCPLLPHSPHLSLPLTTIDDGVPGGSWSI